ncbi:MAG: DUF3857 domain-containing protein [Planctomycetes bacterium]|nr:DUF3857 domain-containing protein [Planctomycetota bacterium]
MELRWRLSRAGRALALAVALLSLGGAARAQVRPDTAPAPAWVTELSPAELAAVPDGADWRVVDQQVHWTPAGTDQYVRYVRRYATRAEVRDGAQLELDYDPSCQRLVLHHLRVLRGSRVLDQLRRADFDLLRAEEESDEQIYSGTATLVAFLHDLREGDVVDWAYTLEGSNPVFAGELFDVVPLGFEVPVGRVRYRWVVPADLAVAHAPSGDAHFVERAFGDERELVRQADDVPAYVLEEDAPAWYHPEPWLQLSTRPTWGDVAAWALPLYQDAIAVDTPEVRALVERLRGEGADDAARAEAALRFVRDEVRYLGIELGASSHRPTPADVTLARRFGDCKDTTVLLVALLRGLGLDAAPALVDSTRRAHVADDLPSPLAFDHVIVHLWLDGRDHWLDPTWLHGRGGLAASETAIYGRALVVKPREDRLRGVRAPELLEPQVLTQRLLSIDDPPGSAWLKLTVEYRGDEAAWVREELETYGAESLAEELRATQAADFGAAVSKSPPTWKDDERADVVRFEAYYALPELRAGPAPAGVLSLYAGGLADRLPIASAPERTGPLALEHPVYVREELRVRGVPGLFVVPREEPRVNEGFTFVRRVWSEVDELVATWEYRSNAESVGPEPAGAVLADAQDASALLELDVVLHPNPSDALTRTFGVNLALLLVGAVAWRLALRPRRDAPPRRVSSGSARVFLAGELAGGLLRVALALVLPLVVAIDWAYAIADLGGAPPRAQLLLYLVVLGAYALASSAALASAIAFRRQLASYPWWNRFARLADLCVAAAAFGCWAALPGSEYAFAIAFLSAGFGLPWGLLWMRHWARDEEGARLLVR